MNECITKPTDPDCECPSTHTRVLIAKDSIHEGNPPRNHFYCSYDSRNCNSGRSGDAEACSCGSNPTYHNCGCGENENKYFLLKNALKPGNPIIDVFTCCPKGSSDPKCQLMETNLKTGYIPPLPGSQEEKEALEKLKGDYEIVNINGQLIYRVKPQTEAPVVKLDQVDTTIVSTEKSTAEGLTVGVISPQTEINIDKEAPTNIAITEAVFSEESVIPTEEVITITDNLIKKVEQGILEDISRDPEKARLLLGDSEISWWGISRKAWMIILILFLMFTAAVYFVIFQEKKPAMMNSRLSSGPNAWFNKMF